MPKGDLFASERYESLAPRTRNECRADAPQQYIQARQEAQQNRVLRRITVDVRVNSPISGRDFPCLMLLSGQMVLRTLEASSRGRSEYHDTSQYTEYRRSNRLLSGTRVMSLRW